MTHHHSSLSRRVSLICASAAAVALSVACGGGGSSSPAPSASTSTFALGSALAAFVKDARTAVFTVSGTGTKDSQTIVLSGSGTASESTVLGTYEGATVYKKTSSIVGNLTAQGINSPLNTAGTENYDLSFKPLGSTTASGYCATTFHVPLPTTVRVGDTGSWYEQTCYTNATRATKILTITVRFQIEPDSESTALWRMQQRIVATSGATISSSTAYRITASGTAVTFANSDSSGNISGVTANLLFTYL